MLRFGLSFVATMMGMILVSTLAAPTVAAASDRQVSVTSALGDVINLDIYNEGGASALLLGPGRNCSPRLDIYDAIALEAKKMNVTVIRLYWSYCVADPVAGAPKSEEAVKTDFDAALAYVRNDLGFQDADISIGGKSMGSLVAHAAFLSAPKIPRLVLLTPVCSVPVLDATGAVVGTENKFDEYYLGLKGETRPVLMVQGNLDPLCDNKVFTDYAAVHGASVKALTVDGNHGFGSYLPDGTMDMKKIEQSLLTLSAWIFANY